MGDLVDFKKKQKQREDELEDTKIDETFDKIIEQNRTVKEKLAKERTEKNKKVLRQYRIKRKDNK